jgi:AcrR family transcriptional regulator
MTQERLKILSFAQAQFVNSGFHNTTMDQIAREMRISKKTIYKHFRTKDDLIKACLDQLTSGVKKSIEQIVGGDFNAVEKLNSIGNVLQNVALKINDKWLNDLKTHYFFIWEEIERFREININKNFKKIIEQGQREGLIIDYPPNAILTIIRSSIQAIITPDFLVNNSISAQEAAKVTLNIIFSGIFTKKGKKLYKNLITDKDNENQ